MTAAPAARDPQLSRQTFRGLGFFLATLAILIFVPAWSLTYWQGLLYWLVFAASTTAITLYFLRRDPALIGRRLNAGAVAESEPTQKIIQTASSVCFIATIIVPALDHLFGWSAVPPWVVIIADVIAALGFYGVFLTFRANSFAAATIQVDPDQRVVSSGPYAVVRHPMYAAAGLMILATPVALGSWWGLIPAVLLIAGVAVRLLDEERFLVLNLPGYARYRKHIRFRLVPGIW
jgi:protein-S-isoprenylcysteine O-methyltransferase Ste14